ncbi:MAG: M20/M25/M40 family metallo-hydrolase [Acidobacteriota bacterium]
MRVLGFILLLAVMAGAQGVEEVYRERARKIIAAALENEEGMKKLEYLCDRIGHRLSGSEAFLKAVAWSAQQMIEGGLENVTTPKVKIPHWERGQESAEIVAPVRAPLGILGLGMTGGGDVTAEVVGVMSFEELEKLGRAGVEGKIVLFHPPWVSYGVTGAFRRQGPTRAAKLGAKAVLIRSAGIPAANSAHTGTTMFDAGVTPIPAGALTEESLGVLERLVKKGERVVVHYRSEAKILPDADGANVIGEIRGSEKPEEVVVISGHLDSWDVGQGAHDDASGCIAPLEALLLLKKLGLRPKRTIRVVFWANEENGTRGGLAYRDQNKEQLKNHVIAIEMDGGAERPLGLGVTGGGEVALKQMQAIGRLLQPIGAGMVTAGGGGTDIGPIMREGVIGSGVRTVGKRYMEWHHTAADTLDKIEPMEFRKHIAQLAVFAYVLADMEERLGRK